MTLPGWGQKVLLLAIIPVPRVVQGAPAVILHNFIHTMKAGGESNINLCAVSLLVRCYTANCR